ncbi:hypothetical protein TSAR_010280 [Trichomalopsis sarcophagae]|uniref:Uncharacterized protein n=1 Tax=Trichomalopsis sarcophagae TaxID=543379 RepID=A0A232EX49_9HYME|nr:hypothetical protein TSAR_010280 [Trichomalopsis sarcophagae]
MPKIKLALHRDIICIDELWRAKLYVDRYRDVDGWPIMKIAKLVLGCRRLAFMVQPGLPYAERIAKIQRALYESGIWKKMGENRNFYNNTNFDTMSMNTDELDEDSFFWKTKTHAIYTYIRGG